MSIYIQGIEKEVVQYNRDGPETIKKEVIFKIEDFLFELKDSRNSDCVAIIGDAGIGKSTLLAKVGEELRRKEASVFLVALKELDNNETVESYLLNKYLTSRLLITDTLKQSWHNTLKSISERGDMWLLLDGLDENQQQGLNIESSWLTKSHIVLTCRGNRLKDKTLARCKTFNILKFNEDNQKEYIERYFKDNSNIGKDLVEKIKDNKVIKALVENPLSLSLICYIYEVDAQLPHNEIEIYQTYLLELLKKKLNEKDRSPKNISRCYYHLHRLLGYISTEILECQNNINKITYEFIQKNCQNEFSNTPDYSIDFLLDIAEEAGWIKYKGEYLNGKYEFINKTFQEYFAASSIDDWDFFLPREHNNDNPHPVPNKKYRVFNDGWQGAIKFWIADAKRSYSEKESFIKNLILFKSKSDNFCFYEEKSKKLASEYIDCLLEYFPDKLDDVDIEEHINEIYTEKIANKNIARRLEQEIVISLVLALFDNNTEIKTVISNQYKLCFQRHYEIIVRSTMLYRHAYHTMRNQNVDIHDSSDIAKSLISEIKKINFKLNKKVNFSLDSFLDLLEKTVINCDIKDVLLHYVALYEFYDIDYFVLEDPMDDTIKFWGVKDIFTILKIDQSHSSNIFQSFESIIKYIIRQYINIFYNEPTSVKKHLNNVDFKIIQHKLEVLLYADEFLKSDFSNNYRSNLVKWTSRKDRFDKYRGDDLDISFNSFQRIVYNTKEDMKKIYEFLNFKRKGLLIERDAASKKYYEYFGKLPKYFYELPEYHPSREILIKKYYDLEYIFLEENRKLGLMIPDAFLRHFQIEKRNVKKIIELAISEKKDIKALLTIYYVLNKFILKDNLAYSVKIVKTVAQQIQSLNYDDEAFYMLLGVVNICCQYISYPEFYKAWNADRIIDSSSNILKSKQSQNFEL